MKCLTRLKVIVSRYAQVQLYKTCNLVIRLELKNVLFDRDLHAGGAAHALPAAAASPLPNESDTDMVKRLTEDLKETAAATKIQASFRGFKSRLQIKGMDQAATKIQAGFRGYKVRKEMKKKETLHKAPILNQKKEIEDSQEIVSVAATKIQAGVRGFLVRRRNQKEQDAATKI